MATPLQDYKFLNKGEKNNDKPHLVFLKTMRVFGLERLFGCFVIVGYLRTHARLIRGCFSFSQCFWAGVFSSLPPPPPPPPPSPLPLTLPISPSLREVSKWRFREQFERPKKTPALQAMFKVFEMIDFCILSSTLRALAPCSFLSDFSRCL